LFYAGNDLLSGTLSRAVQSAAMRFQIVGEIRDVEVIAKGSRIRERKRLWKVYGRGSWRKLKGMANIKLSTGSTLTVELHWYEAHGVGKKEFKIKRIIAKEG
jgi:hypothetical protein